MRTRLFSFVAIVAFTGLLGCSGNPPSDSEPNSFSLQVAPSTVSVAAGGTPRSLTIGATPLNGFDGQISLQVGSLPAGVTATPMTLTLKPGTLQQIKITASADAAPGNGQISVTGTSGTITQNASANLSVGAAGAAPDFSLQVAPSTVSVAAGGTPRSLTIGATALNGFTGDIAVQVGSLPAGVTATPMSFTLTPGALQQIKVVASGATPPGNATISLTGTSGSLTESASAALAVAAAPPAGTTASLSTTFFDFGNNLVNNTVTKTVATVSNTGSGILTLSPMLAGDSSYSIASGGSSCGAQLAAGAACDVVVNYNPTTASSPHTQDATLNLGLGNVPAGTSQVIALTGTSGTMPPGVVTATNNPQVALYTMTLPFPGSVTVNFGTDTNYGLKTWTQSTDTAGGKVSIFVAGMKAMTEYHMQAAVTFSNGLTATDADRTFTTKAIPANMVLNQTTTTTPGMTPQSGLEMLNPISGTPSGVVVTDLAGNTLWTYTDPGNQSDNFIDGVKMMPNGHLLMVIGPTSDLPVRAVIPADTITELREVDLAGNTVREIGLNDLNSELKTATCAGCNGLTLVNFHHDVEVLPNGHMILVANIIRSLSSTTTPPYGTNTTPTKIIGDVLVDLDQNMQPVWAWNEFDYFDPNRDPYPNTMPDWTHTNAVIYSKDDGNLIVSIRHQNWLVKVNYADGSGAGNILWKLGKDGDFTLQGGTDPTDWMYAQHAPSFFSPETAGVFSIGMMDNGDDRIFPDGHYCGTSGEVACYSTIPVWKIDESAKTATFTFHQKIDPSLYNYFGGNAEQLTNGNVEYDLCGVGSGIGPTGESWVREVTPDPANPQTVWSMHVTGTNLYRAFRIPSFYPGVQW